MKSTYYYSHHEEQKKKYREKYHQDKEKGTCGIYKIINKINGKYYIGSSDFIERRIRQHQIKLNGNIHANSHLQNAWNKYGGSNFDFVMIKIVSEKKLIKTEQSYIDNVLDKKVLYNINYEAGRTILSGKNNGMYGKHHSEETRKTWSKKRKGLGSYRADKIIHNFINLKTNEKFIGTRCDLHYKYDIDFAGISRMVNGKRKHYKQWCLF